MNVSGGSGQCSVAGWGATDRQTDKLGVYPSKLREVKVPIRKFNQCRVNYFLHLAASEYGIRSWNFTRKALKKAKDLFFYVQPRQNICAGNEKKDSCAVKCRFLSIVNIVNFC